MIRAAMNPEPTTSAKIPEAPASAVKVIAGGDVLASIIGGLVYLVVAGSGMMQVLAALHLWNPLAWQGRLWTGIFMIAAPTALVVMANLPYRLRQRIPESVLGFAIVVLWVAFFWAACGGH